MDVQIIIAEPPLIEEIDRVFHVRGKPIVFTWGTRIYNPLGVKVEPQIVAHESVHSGRQTQWTGRDDEAQIERWWREYLADPAFRLSEELEAHKAEYRWLAAQTRNRESRNRYLLHVAGKLAAPLYGGIITAREAARQLQGARA